MAGHLERTAAMVKYLWERKSSSSKFDLSQSFQLNIETDKTPVLYIVRKEHGAETHKCYSALAPVPVDGTETPDGQFLEKIDAEDIKSLSFNDAVIVSRLCPLFLSLLFN